MTEQGPEYREWKQGDSPILPPAPEHHYAPDATPLDPVQPSELNEERVRQIVREELAALITQPIVGAVIDSMSNILFGAFGSTDKTAGQGV